MAVLFKLTEMSTNVSFKMKRLMSRGSSLMLMKATVRAPGSKVSKIATVMKDDLIVPPI